LHWSWQEDSLEGDNDMVNEKKTTSGVQELISRLKDNGVKAGQDEAQRMIEEAQEKAINIVAQARSEAKELLESTRAKIEVEKSAAVESLKIAIRDTELMLESKLKVRFTDHVKHLVSRELEDKEMLKQLILKIAGSSCSRISEEKELDLLLLKEKLDPLVSEISGSVLRKGVEIKESESDKAGIFIRMKGEDLEIDLSDNAISEILLKYLLPRYRAILTGVK
jgi:V/A-type H+-transporting ATPase subunit E